MKGAWRLPLLSGLLVGVSYFPGPFLPLNLAGFLPLLYWIESRPTATAYQRLRGGLLFGFTTGLVAFHFMYSMLEQSWLAALLYVGMSMLFGLRIALSVTLVGWLRARTRIWWGVLLPICWLPLEWAQTWGDLRMTGEHLAHTVAGHPFVVQFADVVGPFGVGAFLLATNGLLFDVARLAGRPEQKRAVAALAVLLAAVLGYDLWAWSRPESQERTLRVALIQPDIPLAVKHGRNTAGEQWKTLSELTRQAAESDPDLIVWPESARPVPLFHHVDRPESYAMLELQGLAKSVGTALLVGAEYVVESIDEPRKIYNAAFAIDAEGNLLEDWGAKVYLVPFVEATPFRSILGPLVKGRGGEWHWLAGGFTAVTTSAPVCSRRRSRCGTFR
jgi:apolipoprotein N-acyltransferase